MEVPTLKGVTTIDIKPLTQSNTKYTLKGKGIKFLRGFGCGDLIVTLKGEIPKTLDKNAKKLIKELETKAKEEAAKKALETTTDSYNAAGTSELESDTSSDKDSGKSESSSDNKQEASAQKPADTQKPSGGNSSGSSNNSSNNNTSNSGNQKPPADNSTTQKPSAPAETSDLVLFAAILECEAGGGGYDGLLAVATVIMNRVESPRYPNTLKGVIYQSGQFSPTWNGSLSKVLNRGPSSICYQVARDALNGKRLASVSGCYQFRAASTGHSGTVVGGNVFF